MTQSLYIYTSKDYHMLFFLAEQDTANFIIKENLINNITTINKFLVAVGGKEE